VEKTCQNIFFLHVPKCGGRSIEDAILKGYISIDIRKDIELVREDSETSARVGALLFNYDFNKGSIDDYHILKFREYYLAYLMYQNKKFIRGHFPFSLDIFNEFSNRYLFLTILREPISKWLSNYYYRKNRKSDHWKIKLTMEEYLETDLAKVHGYDYSKYFGGLRSDNNYCVKSNIDLAKNHLSKMHVVGFLDDLEGFAHRLSELIGYNIKVPYLNKSIKDNNAKLSPKLLTKIEKICAPDIEIYNWAKEHLQ
jgi:hypothetical protein